MGSVNNLNKLFSGIESGLFRENLRIATRIENFVSFLYAFHSLEKDII